MATPINGAAMNPVFGIPYVLRYQPLPRWKIDDLTWAIVNVLYDF